MNLFKKCSIAFILLSFTISAPKAQTIDKQSQAILADLVNHYESFRSIDIFFSLTYTHPEYEQQKQSGRVVQTNDQWVYLTEWQDIYCDGTTVWQFLKEDQEIHINSVNDEEKSDQLLTPIDLLKKYKKGEFVHRVLNDEYESDNKFTIIELIPSDDFSDYSKLKLFAIEGEKKINKVIGYDKEGGQFIFEVDTQNTNKSFEKDFFVLDVRQHPDVYIEDLRF